MFAVNVNVDVDIDAGSDATQTSLLRTRNKFVMLTPLHFCCCNKLKKS